ncbi:MAG: hypothetical protein Q9171_000954 [Xanthocarpia ochracea]
MARQAAMEMVVEKCVTRANRSMEMTPIAWKIPDSTNKDALTAPRRSGGILEP